uniref:USP domain-containing protein n=1 Tax=Anopheles epiroticus TaxID=199890 RepID=A0A182PL05_9DIPT
VSTIIVSGTKSIDFFYKTDYKSNSVIVTAITTVMKSLNSMVTHTMNNSLATLCNIGNSCYMNSVLYTLRFAPNFTHNLHHLVEFLDLVLHKTNADKKSLVENNEHSQLNEINFKPNIFFHGQNACSDGLEVMSGYNWNNKDLALNENHVNGYETTATHRTSDGSTLLGEIGFGDNNKCSVLNNIARSCIVHSALSSAYTSDNCNRPNKSESIVSNGCGSKTNRQLVCETLHELFHNLALNEASDTIEPCHAGGLLQAVQRVSSTFEGNQQQDAHEFLMCILDSIRESCQKLNKTIIENPEILKISTLAPIENPRTTKKLNTTESVSTNSESKSGTQFIGRNIFRRRKESLRSTKSLITKHAKSNVAVDISANVKPMTTVKKSIDACMGKDNANLSNETTENVHDSSVTEERLKQRMRTLGLNFFCEDFEGVTVSRTRCLSCETVTEQKEIMVDIAIPITSHEISDALKNPQQFYQDACITQEYFRGDNKYRCEVCSGYTEACRTISFDTLPRLLVLQLKRFNGDMEKINSYIPTPFVLQCFCAECLGKSDDEKRHVYRLYSVITHVGARMSVGHYIAYTSSLQIPLHYINCVKDRQRRALLTASSLEAQPCLAASNGTKNVGFPSSKGHGAVDKSASGQLKKLFGSKKNSSAADISKKLKNNVLNRFSPISGIENLQLNTNATVCVEKAIRTGYSDNFYSNQNTDANNSHVHSSGDIPTTGCNQNESKNDQYAKTRNICDKSTNLNDLTCQSIGCCAVLTKNFFSNDIRHSGFTTGCFDDDSLVGNNLQSNCAHRLPRVSTGSICEINCAHNHYKLDVSNGEPKPAMTNCHSSLSSNTFINQEKYDLTYGNITEDSISKQQITWYMCDDDKIKIMTQLEFEEILSPNRRHNTKNMINKKNSQHLLRNSNININYIKL